MGEGKNRDGAANSFARLAEHLHELPVPTLELLDRQTTAFLYAVWEARGIKKRIVRVEVDGDQQDLQQLRCSD